MKARALCCVGNCQVAVKDIELPDQLAPDEILVAKRFCCLSPGTDSRCLGQFQAGDEPYIMGYSSVGEVVAVGDQVDMPTGSKVFCFGSRHLSMKSQWGAYTSHGIYGADEVIPVPADLDLQQAAIAKLGGIAYHGVRLAKPMPHERIAVVGLGVIGQLAARFYHMTGAQVVAIDTQPKRCDAARAQGITIAEGKDLKSAFAAHFPTGADLVVDATGHPAVLDQSADLLADLPWDDAPRPGPRLLLQGSYPEDFAVNYQKLFMSQTTILIPRDSQRPDLEAVMDLIARGRVDVSDLVADLRPVSEVQQAYDELRSPAASQLTTVVKWD
ncbi:MAG: zinc-dependent alcohol dehydrogenase [Planctomycetota bacterium]